MGVELKIGSSLAFERPLKRKSPGPSDLRSRVLPALTKRQVEVADLLTRSMRHKEIAYKLELSEGYVKVVAHQMYKRVGVRDRIEFAAWYSQRRAAGIMFAGVFDWCESGPVRMGAFE